MNYVYSYKERRILRLKIFIGICIFLAIAILTTLVLRFVIYPVNVRSDSMMPEISNRSLVLVSPLIPVKRGDIGSTAAGYSNAYLGKTPLGDEKVSIYDVDFVTVNPYLGIDGVKPFIDDCKEYGKGIFVLVKTSNKSSGELQDLKLEDGRTIYEKVAELVSSWGEDLVGEYGYSSVGAVVGATYPIQIKELREIMPKTFFLIPGYGAQRRKSRRYSFRIQRWNRRNCKCIKKLNGSI